GFEAEAEQAAISALVALVLKLSEARFKPLFLRLLEWATLPAISTAGGGGGLGRLVALFGAMDALAVHLRSVLVPYYKYVIDLCVQHLTSSGVDAGRPKKKQRKQQQQQQQLEGGDVSGAAGVDAWVLKGRVLRALHRCFLYDSVGFVDQDKVSFLPSWAVQGGLPFAYFMLQ
ncbi:BP28, C-terminal domain-containing protein, partial [Dunaliella salina]